MTETDKMTDKMTETGAKTRSVRTGIYLLGLKMNLSHTHKMAPFKMFDGHDHPVTFMRHCYVGVPFSPPWGLSAV